MDRLTKRHKDSDWRSCEERLAAEADSLGDLLEVVKGHLSPALLDESGWRAVTAAARGWPASCGALPFGFEFQLLDRRPVVDFGLTLVPQGGTAAWIGRQEAAGGFMGRLAGFLDTMGAEGARLNRLIDRVMLEVDIASASPGTPGDPGVFVYFRACESDAAAAPVERPDAEAVLASLNTAAGFADNADEQRLAGSIMSKVPPGVRPVSMGVFPGRGRGFRMSMNGFAHGTVLRKFLRSIGWSGRDDVLEEVIAGLAQGRAAPNLGVMLYCRGDTMECRLGIGSRPLRPDDLPALLENLRGLGCIKTKLSGVRAMVRAPVALWGKGGEFTLLSKFSHVKVVVSQTGIEQIKAYAGFVFA